MYVGVGCTDYAKLVSVFHSPIVLPEPIYRQYFVLVEQIRRNPVNGLHYKALYFLILSDNRISKILGLIFQAHWPGRTTNWAT